MLVRSKAQWLAEDGRLLEATVPTWDHKSAPWRGSEPAPAVVLSFFKCTLEYVVEEKRVPPLARTRRVLVAAELARTRKPTRS